MSEFFWDGYRAAIKARIQKHIEYLADGKAGSFERYKEVAGTIAGLKESLAELNDCLKKAGQEEEEIYGED